MSNHSVIEHRANYYYIKLEEDYIEICSQGKEYPHCKAFILAILEHWMDDKRSKGQSEYIYMSYPQWIDAMYGLFRRNHIINCLNELVEDHLIFKRPYRTNGKDTFEYCLNVSEVQSRLKALEERKEKYTRPKVNAFKFKRVEKQTGVNLNDETDTNLNASEGDDPFKFKHNIESITEIPKDRETEESTGEQLNTDTFASSLPLDASPSSLQSEIDHHSQSSPTIGDTAHVLVTPLDYPPAVAADQPALPGEAIVAAESGTALDRGTPHRVQPAPEYPVSTDGEVLDVYLPPGSADRIPPLPSADMGDLSPSGQDLRSLSSASRMALEAGEEEIDEEATVPRLAAVIPSEQSSSLSAAVELGQGTGSPLPAAPATQHGINAQERSHAQDRDTLPRPVAVTRDSGSSPRPTPPADPGVSPLTKTKKARTKDEPTKQQIDAVYVVFDELYQGVLEDPEFTCPHTSTSTAAIKELIKRKASPGRLRQVFTDMWDDEDEDGTFWWRGRGRMTIKAVCNHYASRLATIQSRTKATLRLVPKVEPKLPPPMPTDAELRKMVY